MVNVVRGGRLVQQWAGRAANMWRAVGRAIADRVRGATFWAMSDAEVEELKKKKKKKEMAGLLRSAKSTAGVWDRRRKVWDSSSVTGVWDRRKIWGGSMKPKE